MSRVTNHHALSLELHLAYEKAVQRFPDRRDDIDEVFEAANELHMSFRVIDQCVETMDSKWAVDAASKFMQLAHRVFRLSDDSISLFTWQEMPVAWRGSPAKNIVLALAYEADMYMLILEDFLYPGGRASEEEILLSLCTRIRLRAAKDNDSEHVWSASTWTPDAEIEPGTPNVVVEPFRVIRWSDYRQPQVWRRLRKLKGLSFSINIWPRLCRDNPYDIQCESTQSARISFELAQSWGLDLPEFRT